MVPPGSARGHEKGLIMTTANTSPRTSSLVLPRIGAVIAVILVVSDVVGTIRYSDDPLPAVIAAFILSLGALTLVGFYPAWRGRTWGIWLSAGHDSCQSFRRCRS